MRIVRTEGDAMRSSRCLVSVLVASVYFVLAPFAFAQSGTDDIDAVQQKLDAAKRAQAEKDARARREAAESKAREEADRREQTRAAAAAAATAAAEAAPKGPNLQETLDWLRGYFATTSEAFEGYDTSTKTISTIQRVDASTTNRYAYDICSARRISPTIRINWNWVETSANGYLSIGWAGVRGCMGPASACKSFSAWLFSFPQPTTLISTEPNPAGGTRIVSGAAEIARDRLLSDAGHPVHRFRRAFERLIELECGGSVDSPFD